MNGAAENLNLKSFRAETMCGELTLYIEPAEIPEIYEYAIVGYPSRHCVLFMNGGKIVKRVPASATRLKLMEGIELA